MVKNAALVLVSIVVALLLLEGGLRLSGRFATVGLHSVSQDDYERIPGLWEPGQDFLNLEKPELPHRIRINSLGLRGSEITLEPHGLRVLCIGDSFTFGDFVNDDETLPMQLEKSLAGGIEVINGGVGGTTIVDHRVFLERLLVLRPHVVLLTFSENDLQDLYKDPPRHIQFQQNRKLKSGWLSPIFTFARDTALFNALLHVRAVFRAKDTAVRTDPAPVPMKAVSRYVSETVSMKNLLDSKGVGFIFATFPSHTTVNGTGNGDRIGAVLAALKQVGISGVDLTIPLRRSRIPVTELYLLPHDGHASPRGNAIAAEALVSYVKQSLEKHSVKVKR